MSTHVLYLALGESRVRGTRVHVEKLAAAGREVVLVVSGHAAWDDLPEIPGVRVLRAGLNKKGSAWRAARKLVLAKDGPLKNADLLVAGDAQALPVAWTALRRRPGLEFRLEPYENTERVTEPADLAVLTPWYPSPNNPFAGSFVQAAAEAVAHRYDRISILHTEDWPGSADPLLQDAIKATAERFLDRRELIPVLDTPEGVVTRVPVPISVRRNYAVWVARQEEALRKALPTGRIEAPVVHAHTGIYGGVLAMHLARPDARIVVTEHSSFLEKVFRQPAGRKLYDEVLHRADEFLCVSKHLRDQIVREFPHHDGKIRIVPNVIDFERFTAEAKPSEKLLKWLYVGRLLPAKGVVPLLEAFALVAEKEPEATLTMVGAGSLREQLLERAEELGLGDRFTILPPVQPEEVNGLMHRYDLLVHASRAETFGMTVVEANAAGLPVLVTRSRGPEETLAGIEELAGGLMDVSDDPQVIVDAYWELRERFDQLDLDRAREVLVSRYSREVVGRRLIEVYEDRAPAIEPDPEPDDAVDTEAAEAVAATPAAPAAQAADGAPAPGRALLLAYTPARPRRVADFANYLAARGIEVHLVTAREGAWARTQLDERVRVHNIEKAEQRLLIPRGERFVVYRAPRAVLRRVDRLAGKQRDKVAPELAVKATWRAHSKLASGFHKKVFHRGYRVVRPRIYAKIAEREVLPQLRLDPTDVVFACDTNAAPTAWRIAQAYPELRVTNEMDRAKFEHLPVVDPAGS
ncbi:glycosyltransferase [Streptomyces sp. NPDC006307]|uniref:glycosyltransferase n=1 Tax=Streptomyces sp. NPDC006307 TaxID=3156748 RepID=UPI0033B36F40